MAFQKYQLTTIVYLYTLKHMCNTRSMCIRTITFQQNGISIHLRSLKLLQIAIRLLVQVESVAITVHQYSSTCIQMSCHYHDLSQNTTIAFLIASKYRQRQLIATRTTNSNRKIYTNGQLHHYHGRRFSVLCSISFVLISLIGLPAYSWLLLPIIPKFNCMNLYRSDVFFHQTSCTTTKQHFIQQEDNNDIDDANVPLFTNDEEKSANTVNNIQDDSDITDSASDVGSAITSESTSSDSSVTNTTTYQDNMTDRFKYKVRSMK